MLLATQVISQLFSSVVMKSTDSDLCWTGDNVGNLNQCVSIHATSLIACAQSITGVYDPPPIILHCSSNEKLRKWCVMWYKYITRSYLTLSWNVIQDRVKLRYTYISYSHQHKGNQIYLCYCHFKSPPSFTIFGLHMQKAWKCIIFLCLKMLRSHVQRFVSTNVATYQCMIVLLEAVGWLLDTV